MNKKLLSGALLLGSIALVPGVTANAEEINNNASMQFVTDNLAVVNEDTSNGSATYEMYHMGSAVDPVAIYPNGDLDSAFVSIVEMETDYLGAVADNGNYSTLGTSLDFSGYAVTVSSSFTITSSGEPVEMPSSFYLYIPSMVDFVNGGTNFDGGSVYAQAGVGEPVYEIDGSSYEPTNAEETSFDFVLPVTIDGVEGAYTFSRVDGVLVDESIVFTPDTDGDGIYDDVDTDDDNDGLLDTVEATLGTNSLLADSDGDGFTDGEEVEMMTDPLDETDFPVEEEEEETDGGTTTGGEDEEEDKLANTGNGAPTGLLAALGSALFIFKRK